MKKAEVKVHNERAGVFIEIDRSRYEFHYDYEYSGSPISLTLPVREEPYLFDSFPPFFDGVLPEGIQLEGLLKKYKLDSADYFQQLMKTGADLVGAVTVVEIVTENE